jgi:hypothetical protein
MLCLQHLLGIGTAFAPHLRATLHHIAPHCLPSLATAPFIGDIKRITSTFVLNTVKLWSHLYHWPNGQVAKRRLLLYSRDNKKESLDADTTALPRVYIVVIVASPLVSLSTNVRCSDVANAMKKTRKWKKKNATQDPALYVTVCFFASFACRRRRRRFLFLLAATRQ